MNTAIIKSSDAGNTLVIGSDGGLYSTATGTGGGAGTTSVFSQDDTTGVITHNDGNSTVVNADVVSADLLNALSVGSDGGSLAEFLTVANIPCQLTDNDKFMNGEITTAWINKAMYFNALNVNNITTPCNRLVAVSTNGSATGVNSAVIAANNGTASGGNSFAGGGSGNVSSGANSGILGGGNTTASGIGSAGVGGVGLNISGFLSGAIAGQNNIVSGSRSAGIAGLDNEITGTNSVVAGATESKATNSRDFVGGGSQNEANGGQSGVIGGELNIVNQLFSVITGGTNNLINEARDFIGGGEGNVSSGGQAGIIAGLNNAVNALFSVIIGGEANTIVADSVRAVILGGRGNEIDTGTSTSGSTVIAASQYTKSSDQFALVGGYNASAPALTSNRNWQISSLTGNMAISGSYFSGITFPDFAEYMRNDREGIIKIGTVVTLSDTGGVVIAKKGDLIYGVVSGSAAYVAGDAPIDYQSKYLVDEFGVKITKPQLVGLKLVDLPVKNPSYSEGTKTRSQAPELFSLVGLLGQPLSRISENVSEGDFLDVDNGIFVKSDKVTGARCLKLTQKYKDNKGYGICSVLLKNPIN